MSEMQNRYKTESFFESILQQSKINSKINDLIKNARIKIGKISYFNSTNGFIRVLDNNQQSNYSSGILKPTGTMKAAKNILKLGLLVGYFYTDEFNKNGYYFALIEDELSSDPLPEFDFINASQAQILIDTSITNYNTNSIVPVYATIANLNNVETNLETEKLERRLTTVNNFRYINQLSLANGGGDFAAATGWTNRVVTFHVTGVPGRIPPPAPTNPTPIDHSNAKYRIIFNSTVNSNTVTGDEFYFRIDSSYRHYVLGNGSTLVNGNTNENTMLPKTTWRVLKVGNNTFSLTQVDFDINPY